MSVFPDGSKIKTEVPVRNRRSRCRGSARNNSEAQRWHSQLPPTEIELLGKSNIFINKSCKSTFCMRDLMGLTNSLPQETQQVRA